MKNIENLWKEAQKQLEWRKAIVTPREEKRKEKKKTAGYRGLVNL